MIVKLKDVVNAVQSLNELNSQKTKNIKLVFKLGQNIKVLQDVVEGYKKKKKKIVDQYPILVEKLDDLEGDEKVKKMKERREVETKVNKELQEFLENEEEDVSFKMITLDELESIEVSGNDMHHLMNLGILEDSI